MMMRVRRTLSEARLSTVYPAPTEGFGRAKPDRDVRQTTLLGDMLDFQRSGQILARYELKRHVADRRPLSCLGSHGVHIKPCQTWSTCRLGTPLHAWSADYVGGRFGAGRFGGSAWVSPVGLASDRSR